jgi:4'-phosphopantetheinyl transferase EntD
MLVETAVPALVAEQLFPEERAYIARAVEIRQAQFGSARVCARRALSRLGIAPCALVPKSDRSPNWPSGIKGSIAHTEQHCAVALTDAHQIAAVGLDVESDTPLKAGLEEVVCTEAELLWLQRFDRIAMGWLGTLVFSAKEAFYKCQFPITETILDFQDVELRLDLDEARFLVADLRPGIPQRSKVLRIEGRLGRAMDSLVTTATLSA